MICRSCKKDIAEGSVFCNWCGKKQTVKASHSAKKMRGNGQGTVVKLKNGKYKATVTLVYYKDDDGKLKRKTRSKTFALKKDAVAALATLADVPAAKPKKSITFKELYDRWYPTHNAGESTLGCYRAAMKHFKPVWYMSILDIDIDDLQDCVDGCGCGKRTQQNMKAVCGLVYKYGIPRQAVPENLNLAPYITISGDGAARRSSFTEEQIQSIKSQIGVTYNAEAVYCLIYLGFRPSEFLDLKVENYNAEEKLFVAGAKTTAGINRVVTVSPKIQPYIDKAVAGRTEGPLFFDLEGKPYRLKPFTENVFYATLDGAGIENPMVDIAGGIKRHKYTPHSCRHTFSTLMKRIDAPSKDKLELIGHSSEEMLRYYQDVNISDLRKITDML